MDTVMDILGVLKYIGIGLISFFAFCIVCIHNNCTILYTISSNNVYN